MDMHERSSNPLLTFLSLGTTDCHYLRTDSYPCLHRCGKLFKQTTLATRADLNSFPFISNFHGCPFKLSTWNSYGCLLFSEPTLQIFQIWFNGISIHLKTSMKTIFWDPHVAAVGCRPLAVLLSKQNTRNSGRIPPRRPRNGDQSGLLNPNGWCCCWWRSHDEDEWWW